MKKKSLKNLTVVLASLLLLVGLVGCKGEELKSEAVDENTKVVGSLLLSVNPEIKLNYDKDGKVVELLGVNDDGKNILNEYKSYVGKESKEVIRELVEEINKKGYFKVNEDGSGKNIVIKLEPNSQEIKDEFLNEIAEEINKLVAERKLNSKVLEINNDDYSEKYRDKGYVNKTKAEEILKSSLNKNNITIIEKEYDIDDGKYEIEFIENGKKYEYEVDAVTGKVLEMEVDDIDDDYVNIPTQQKQPVQVNIPVQQSWDDNDDWDDNNWDNDDNDNWDNDWNDNWNDDNGWDNNWNNDNNDWDDNNNWDDDNWNENDWNDNND
ncbi:PepSY domain-containing protein [Anaerosphaera multitolerans]|nr:PepSY domain-containing protein [Anaerosphaera multitolerans]